MKFRWAYKMLLKFPLVCLCIIFLTFAVPINYLFLADYPDNPLEKLEEFVIEFITGIHVDFNPQK